MTRWRQCVLVVLAVALSVPVGSGIASAEPVKDKTGCKSKLKSPVPKDALATAPFVAGNASPPLAPGEPKKATVIAVGTTISYGSISGSIPVVVRNNSCKALMRVTVSATARDAAGQLIGAGADQGIEPTRLAPGEVGFGNLYFDGDPTFPPDVRYEFKVTGHASKGPEDTGDQPPVAITKHKFNIQSGHDTSTVTVIATVQNKSKAKITGPIRVTLVCFNKAGQPVAEAVDFVEADVLKPGASAPLNISLSGVDACPIHLMAGSGFNSKTTRSTPSAESRAPRNSITWASS